jgi:uncharacterized protein (TIGR03437 family)
MVPGELLRAPGLGVRVTMDFSLCFVGNEGGFGRCHKRSRHCESRPSEFFGSRRGIHGRPGNRLADVGRQFLSGQAAVSTLAPAIFTADGSGSGVPIRIVYTAHADSTQASQAVYECNSPGCQTTAIDVSKSGDTNVLVLYATGIRNAVLTSITAQIGSTSPPVLFAGAQSQFPGLDQVNLQLPASLAGSGQVTLQITAAGQKANPVKLLFR